MEGSSRIVRRGELGAGNPAFTRVKAILSVVVPLLLGVFLVTLVLAVNTFPIIGNDGVLYIDHSRNLAAQGWVENGYRQFGYPLFLAVTRFFADSVGLEPLLTTSVVQRLLLVGAVLVSWRMWRWWSLPLIVFLVAAPTLVYPNFLLTESLALALAVLLVFPTARLLEHLNGRPASPRILTVLGVLVVAGVVILYALRFTYLVFGVVPLILAIRAWKTPHRRLGLAMLGVTALLIGVTAVMTSVENQREHGEFAPSVRDEPVRYYFAWQQVFTVRPENQADPALARFFDNGVVHDFGRGVGNLTPEEERQVYDAEIEAMFEAARMSLAQTKLTSFLSALVGGRIDDIGSIVDGAILSERQTVDELIYLNQYAMENGIGEFADTFNDGQRAEAVITDPIGSPWLIPPTRTLLKVLGPLALLTMAVGLAFRASRWLAFTGLAVMVSFALGMGWLMADNLRFLMPTTAFGIACACGVMAVLMRDRSRRRGEPDSDPVDHDHREHRVLAS